MPNLRKENEAWLNGALRKRCPESVDLMAAAFDAYDMIEKHQKVTPKLLACVVDAASTSHVWIYETAADMLGKLTETFFEARDAVSGMASNPKSHVRFNSILCLKKMTPKPFSLQILRQCLRDKSARVRQKAADWSGRLRLRKITPDLEKAALCEKNVKVRETIDFDLRLLRDGYILKPAKGDRVWVTTFTHEGTISFGYSTAELKQRGIEAIIAELRKPEY